MRKLVILSLYIFTSCCVPITGHAKNYIGDAPIEQADLTVLEYKMFLKTDDNGFFRFEGNVGDNVTIVLHKEGFHTTQTSTVIVPEGGCVGIQKEIVLQVPSDLVYDLFRLVLPVDSDPTKCHFAVTVAAKGKTTHNDPQGEPNSTVSMDTYQGDPFYFGYLDGLTDPFVRDLNQTSLDGGVLFFNVEPRAEPYVISAHKKGAQFSQTKMKCIRQDSFVNGAPPWGPRVQ